MLFYLIVYLRYKKRFDLLKSWGVRAFVLTLRKEVDSFPDVSAFLFLDYVSSLLVVFYKIFQIDLFFVMHQKLGNVDAKIRIIRVF